MWRSIIAGAAALAIVASVPATAQRAKDDDEGVKVRRASFMRNFVSAGNLEKAALAQYGQLRAQATGRNSLVPDEDAQAKRVQRIAQELLQHTAREPPRQGLALGGHSRQDADGRALCMPGGKIAVFTGIIDTLKLDDGSRSCWATRWRCPREHALRRPR
jgi:hypothetical protein